MAARSSFSREQQLQVHEACRRLVRGVLQENATPNNIAEAQEWCLHRLRDHQYPDTNPGEVTRRFQHLLDKYRVHSQLEAADYLEEMQAAFLKCRLSQRYTDAAHAGVLRALLLLADRPVDVPLRTIRDLRRISERRKHAAAQQQRSANEQSLDRLALLKLELKQVAEGASRAWDEAWSESEALLVEDSFSSPQAVEAEMVPEQASRQMVPPRGTRAMSGRQRADAVETLSRGALPRPSWQRQSMTSSSPSSPIIVSEQAVVEMSLQMLAGYPGEMLDLASDGKLTWRPVKVHQFSAEALSALLRPLAVFGTALTRLRAFVSLLQDVGLPLADPGLSQQVCKAAVDREFGLREITRLHTSAETGGGEFALRQSSRNDLYIDCVVFGLCWQGFGLALQDLLEDLAIELRKLQASFCTAREGSSMRQTPSSAVALTLLQLERWAEPHRSTVMAVADVIDTSLLEVSKRCTERPSKLWAEASAEELLTHLARALQGDQLLRHGLMGGFGNWLVRLWNGAARPVLRAMDQWAAAGELHDPCGEFPGITGKGGGEPALLPRLVTSGGRHARSLRNWTEASGSHRAAQQREEAPMELGTAHMLAHEQSVHWASKSCVPLEASLEALALEPARRLSQAVTKPFFSHVLLDASRGLLAHLAALRLVAFLEREDVAAPLTWHLFDHVRRHTPLGSARDAVVMDLNATLAESLDCQEVPDATAPATRLTAAKLLCSKHLMLSVVEESGGSGGFSFGCLRLRYAAPDPLNSVLTEEALSTYSSLLVLLLRVRHAQSMLVALHSLPIFGFSNRARRTWQGNMSVMAQPLAQLTNLAHECDMLRAKLGHFLGCLERHLRMDVVQDTTRSLDKQLLNLAEAGPAQLQKREDSQQGESLLEAQAYGEAYLETFDAVARAGRLHAAYLHRLKQECFLAPELRSVLEDLEHLISLAPQLHHVLDGLLKHLHRGESELRAPPTPIGRESTDVLGADKKTAEMDEDALDLDSHEAGHAIATAAVQVARIQQEFHNGASFLLQALMFSVARGPGRRVSDLCLQMNFNNFYHKEM